MKRQTFFTMTLVAMTLASIISCTQGTTSKEALVVKISAKDLGGLDEIQWSEVKEIDGKEARVIQQDEVVFTVPAWWGNNARPNEGDIFVLEIDYQDVASNPFIVSSFGNCANSIKYPGGQENSAGKPNGLSELHRIVGGTARNGKLLWFLCHGTTCMLVLVIQKVQGTRNSVSGWRAMIKTCRYRR